MSAHQQGQLFDLSLPLMYTDSNRSLTTAYVSVNAIERFEEIRQAASRFGAALSLVYTYWDPAQQQYFGALVLDETLHQDEPQKIIDALEQVPGVTIEHSKGPSTGLVALEQNMLNVAGTRVSVIAQAYLGGTYRRLLESLGDQAAEVLFQSGENAGQQAAAAVPGVAEKLGISVTPAIIQERFYDLQVFGWSKVSSLRVDDQFTGEALLADTFESAAWQGEASAPVCHWIRGFLSGVLSTALEQPFQVNEAECQAKGDAHCRFEFQQ